ncbi:hypothetical protein TWF718_009981 [Orbilia javanica]|uniref:Uncharacterized protein n=1 Tax=Orbilia javanica TaxID=47235 RepID=A0AAN8MXT6_9PEZI
MLSRQPSPVSEPQPSSENNPPKFKAYHLISPSILRRRRRKRARLKMEKLSAANNLKADASLNGDQSQS